MKLKYKLAFYFFFLSVVPLIFLNQYIQQEVRISTENIIIARLTSVVEEEAEDLNRELQEVINDLKINSNEVSLSLTLSGNYESDIDLEERVYVLEQSKNLIKNNRELLINSSGLIIASTNKEDIGKITKEDFFTFPFETNDVYLGKIHENKDGILVMFISSPVFKFDSEKGGKTPEVVGVLVYELDVNQKLFLNIESWAGIGDTGETLIVRREDEEILFLNELRHQKDSSLKLRISLDSDLAKSAIFASGGNEGVIRTTDYRGIKVLSAYKYIPITGWGIVTKIDEQEAFAPITLLSRNIGLMMTGWSVALFITALFILFSITKPINKLRDGAKIIAGGELSHEIKIESEDEMGELAAAFNNMTTELAEYQDKIVRSEKLSTIGKLSGIIAHDIRNPLGTIGNSIYILNMELKENTDSMIKKHLRIIQEEVNNSNKIITSVLDFAQKKPPELEVVNINDVVKNVLSKLNIPKEIKVQTDLTTNLPKIKIDVNQIGLVFSNLIENAYQAMPDGGTLNISSSKTDDYTSIAFMDTGAGIAKKNMDKLFEPLFTTKVDGVGLGLVTCKNIIEAHKGKIDVMSEKGKGTTFTIKLNTSIE